MTSILAVSLLVVLVLLAREIYRDRTMRRAVRDIVDDVDRGDRVPACRHLGCMRARNKLRALVDRHHHQEIP